MDTYIVIYKDIIGDIFCFKCNADDFEHAEEQVYSAYQDISDILWITKCTNPDYSDEGKWVG